MGVLVLAYDVGTTGMKTCLFEIGDTVRLVASTSEGYGLRILPGGGAEQDPLDWWYALRTTTKRILSENGVRPDAVAGISFCSQMQGLVLVDAAGNPVRPAMSYMDQRATGELHEGLGRGFRIAGMNAFRLLRSLAITGAVPASVKDPVWKYRWVAKNEPEVFDRIHKWLDVKEFLIRKCTGRFVMTRDSAFATLLFDTREGRVGFNGELCSMFGVDVSHLPEVIRCAEAAGVVTEEAAEETGLAAGTPVFGGGGDASLIGIGAGAVAVGNTHVYSGTSGWVSTVVNRRIVDVNSMIASIVGAGDGTFNYFAELETAGKCLEWVRDHLALDEIGLYLEKSGLAGSRETVPGTRPAVGTAGFARSVRPADSRERPSFSEAGGPGATEVGRRGVGSHEAVSVGLYDYMMQAVKDVPAGSNGVVFAPWLHGNRCPFEDPRARGMFFNIGLETGKTDLIHAVLEGVFYHLNWMLEAQDRKVKTSGTVRFVGGGALSPVTCRILADVLGRPVETTENPQNAGAAGAALVAAVGLGLLGRLEDAQDFVRPSARFEPDPSTRKVHDRNFLVFKSLYAANRKSFRILNE